jgi:hypothetical protein
MDATGLRVSLDMERVKLGLWGPQVSLGQMAKKVLRENPPWEGKD